MDSKEVKLTFITFRDDDQVSALCLEFDIAAYGNTEQEAVDELLNLVKDYITHKASQGIVEPEEMMQRVPSNVISDLVGVREGPSSGEPQRRDEATFWTVVQPVAVHA